jgi:hypothetical protein
MFLLFSFSYNRSGSPHFYDWSTATESFERFFSSAFVCTGSNLSMDTMADSGASSGAMSDAHCDDLSRLLF